VAPRLSAAQDASAPVDLRGIWNEARRDPKKSLDAKKASARGLDAGTMEAPVLLGRLRVPYSRIEGSTKQSGTVRMACRLTAAGVTSDCVVHALGGTPARRGRPGERRELALTRRSR
jgi:hypothetical protein